MVNPIKIGDKFGMWTVERPLDNAKTLCVCECGARAAVLNGNLRRRIKPSRSCNSCSKIGNLGARKYCKEMPGGIYRRLSCIVGNAIKRCTDSNHRQWKDYGERGIRICDEWLRDHQKFIRYLATLENHDNPAFVIDRRDNDKGYQPGNLRFVSRSQSSLNRRPFGHLLAKDHRGRFCGT